MKKPLCLLLVFFLLISSFTDFPPALHAQTTTQTTTAAQTPASTEFDMSDFPLWAKDLRRAEIIAFGSFPFAYIVSNFGFDLYRFANNGGDRRYAPWPFNSAGTIEKTQDQKFITLGVTAGVAVLFALVDYAIVRAKRKRAERESGSLPAGTPIIIRKPLNEAEAAAPDMEQAPLPVTETP